MFEDVDVFDFMWDPYGSDLRTCEWVVHRVWMSTEAVLQRLGNFVRDVTFDRGVQTAPALSPQHYRRMMEQSGGPIVRLLQSLKDDPARMAEFRRAYEGIVAQYFDRNVVHQDFLMTRAIKA